MATRELSFGQKIKFFSANSLFLFGLFWTCFSMIFVFAFLHDFVISDEIALRSSDTFCQGKVVGKETTNSRINKQRVYAYTINYEISNLKYNIVSYSTEKIEEGSTLKVKYVISNPAVAVADNMSKSTFGIGIIFILIFPIIGILLLIFSTISSYRNLVIVLNGQIALGKYIDKEPTNVKINNRTVMKIKFSFKDRYGREQITYAETAETGKLLNDALEVLIYMPNSPSESVFVDTLSKSIRKSLVSEIQKVKSNNTFL